MASQNGATPKPTYSVKEVAQLLGKSEATIRRWIREGKLESRKPRQHQQGKHIIPHHSVAEYLGSG
ncbi:MAG: helix-turn-helix domain-containing protein [Candidatus Brocadiae bacterium]|nr:helix-turn-helix domain-containing protein [Candidatus Brocadiia bacterium]